MLHASLQLRTIYSLVAYYMQINEEQFFNLHNSFKSYVICLRWLQLDVSVLHKLIVQSQASRQWPDIKTAVRGLSSLENEAAALCDFSMFEELDYKDDSHLIQITYKKKYTKSNSHT